MDRSVSRTCSFRRSRWPAVDDAAYLTDKRANITGNFGTEFLDIAAVTQKFAKESFNTYRNAAFGYIAAAAFILGLLTFFLNFGNLLLVQRFLQPSDATRAELFKDTLEQEVKVITAQNHDLAGRLLKLDQGVAARTQQLDSLIARINQLEKDTPSAKGLAQPVPEK
jgi:hypothetical protein